MEGSRDEAVELRVANDELYASLDQAGMYVAVKMHSVFEEKRGIW